MNLISEIIRGTWMMHPASAHLYFPLVHKIITQEISPQDQSIELPEPHSNSALVSPFDFIDNPESIDSPSIFSIGISGAITKYKQYSGNYGMKFYSELLKAADQHPSIHSHLIRIDSPGGEGHAARLMHNTIKSLKKPVIAYVESMAASAAYWIASACDHIVCSDTSDLVGSIGTYITLTDYRKHYEQKGINITTIYATASTHKNKAYLNALDGNFDAIQKELDAFNDFFIQDVISARADKLTLSKNIWSTGDTFYALKAVQIGLIDQILPIEQVITQMQSEYSPNK